MQDKESIEKLKERVRAKIKANPLQAKQRLEKFCSDKNFTREAERLLLFKKLTCEEYTTLENNVIPIVADLLRQIDELTKK